MTVKIIIRRIVPKNADPILMPLLRELREHAIEQPGYISGETLRGLENPTDHVVIGTWQSADDWKNWALNKDREKIQMKIDTLLGQKTEYTIYNYG
ncbi:MAG: antibiotic biosynthesis monooxygenase [Desulfobacterales bacterium]|nr:antibiotic biosynthesis monooxygenase [Desulfobacterales bacterium]